MGELKELSNRLSDIVKKLKQNKDIVEAVKELKLIKIRLDKIINENVWDRDYINC